MRDKNAITDHIKNVAETQQHRFLSFLHSIDLWYQTYDTRSC